jgi:hypothetical protein
MGEISNLAWKPETPLLISVEQTAALLGVSARTVWNLLAGRELVRRGSGLSRA